MVSVRRYPQTISQVKQPNTVYQQWNSVNNLKAWGSYAKTGTLSTTKRRENQASYLYLTNYKLNLPEGAVVTRLTVRYINYTPVTGKGKTKKYAKVGKPTISLIGTKKPQSKAGRTVTTKANVSSVTFTGVWSGTELNQAGFGLKVSYPRNISKKTGTLAVNTFEITADYVINPYPSMEVVSTSNKQDLMNQETTTIKFKVNDTHKRTVNNVNLLVQSVSNLTYQSVTGATYGNTVTISGVTYHKFTYKPSNYQGNINVTFKASQTSSSTTSSVLVKTQTNMNSATESTTTLKFTTTAETYTAKHDLPSTLVKSSSAVDTFTVTVTIDTDSIKSAKLTPVWDTGLFTTIPSYNGNPVTSGEAFTINFTDRTATIEFNGAIANGTGATYYDDTTFTISNTVSSVTETINPKVYLLSTTPIISDLPYNDYTISSSSTSVYEDLIEGETYKLITYMKVTTETSNISIIDYETNYSIGAWQGVSESPLRTGYEPTDKSQIVWSEGVTTYNEWCMLQVDLENYDKTKPLHILITGQYNQLVNYDNATIEFTEPYIVVKGDYESIGEIETQKDFPKPLPQLLTNNGATITLNANSTSGTFYLINPNLTELENPLHGLELEIETSATGDSKDTGTILLYSHIIDLDSWKVHTSQIQNITDSTTSINIGGAFEDWETTTDQWNSGNMGIGLFLQNTNPTPTTLTLKNATLTIYTYTQNFKDLEGFTINGVHSHEYGIFFQSVENNQGLTNNTTYKQLSHSDKITPTNSILASKTIKLGFSIPGQTVEEAQEYTSRVARYLATPKNHQNIPQTKEIIFDHLPNRKYNYLLDEAITTKLELTDAVCETTINIPDGVGRSTQQTVTAETGSIKGLKRVLPIITILPGADTIIITKNPGKSDEQSMTITYTGLTGTNLIINNETHTITINGETLPLDNISFNSQWFTIDNDYTFTIDNGTIQQIAYTEYY